MSLDERGRVVGRDIATQARNALDALKRVLAEAGATMADVVKHNVYLVCDGDDAAVARFMAELDKVRLRFPRSRPDHHRSALRTRTRGSADPGRRLGGGRRGKERLMPPGHWRWGKPLPFSHGWKVGDMVFVGGQRSLDDRWQTLGVGDIEVQTDHAFRNLDTMLRAAGGDRHNLMRQNTYFRFFGEGREVTDYWEKMTNVRRRYMSVPSAAGAGLRIAGMAQSTN